MQNFFIYTYVKYIANSICIVFIYKYMSGLEYSYRYISGSMYEKLCRKCNNSLGEIRHFVKKVESRDMYYSKCICNDTFTSLWSVITRNWIIGYPKSTKSLMKIAFLHLFSILWGILIWWFFKIIGPHEHFRNPIRH